MANREPPRTMNPLWIISLFLGLSEVTIGVVVTQSAGWIQGMLAIFAVMFPIGTAITFFFILWNKPFVLYAPRDYSKDTTVSTFVEAMTITTSRQDREIEALVRSSVESVIMKNASAGVSEQQINADVELAVQVARDNFERMQVSIDASEVLKHVNLAASSARILVDETMTVQDFLDEVWSSLYPAFQPYTYGDHWILEYSTGQQVNSTVTARSNLLRQSGIKPGDHLRVVLLPRYNPRY